MKRKIIAGTIVILLVLEGLYIVQSRRSTPSFDDLNHGLAFLVSDFVAKDSSVYNCVLSVMNGDGSFSWAGAAGFSRQDGGLPMTPNTPIYIASITKLYTATIISRKLFKWT